MIGHIERCTHRCVVCFVLLYAQFRAKNKKSVAIFICSCPLLATDGDYIFVPSGIPQAIYTVVAL